MSIQRNTLWFTVSFLFIGYLVWIFAWEQETFASMAGINVFQTAAAFMAAFLLYRRYRIHKSVKWNHWFFYAMGVFSYFLAQLYWTVYFITYRAEPETMGIPEILWVGQYVFYIIALRFQIAKRKSGYPLLRFYLDILIFTICAVALYWHFFLESKLTEPIYQTSWIMLDFVCSTSNAGIFFGLFALYFFDRTLEKARDLLLLTIGFAMKIIGNTSHLHDGLSGTNQFLYNQMPDFFWFAGLLFLGLAASSRENGKSSAQEDAFVSKPPSYKMYVPFLVIACMGLAMICGIERPTALMLGMAFTIIFLLIRLWLSMLGYQSAEKALSEAERKYRDLVENSQVGVFSNQNGFLTYVNRYFANTFGYTQEEMIGTPFTNYFTPEDQQRLHDEAAKLKATNELSSLILAVGIKKGGQEVHLEVQVTRTIHQGAPAITGTLIDITERKLVEEMVIRSEKLSVVGQLAAGVAHEIRNPLTSLKGFTQLLKARSQSLYETNYFDIMLTELDRINYIVGEFMLLSKPRQMQKLEVHDLKELLQSMLPIIETQAIIHNVIIDVDWEANIQPVRCDKNEIKQVFVNLLKNAIEAMTKGGTIRIGFYEISGLFSCVRIEDQGPGMPQDILSRLGEPFFTTKSTGTGLGLMVCYRIVEAHNGKIYITSPPDKGTIVEVQLQAAG